MPPITNNQEVKLEKTDKKDSEKTIEEGALPIYMEKLDLSDEQKKRAIKEIEAELDEIKKEREEDNLEEKWDALDDQYEGKATEDTMRQFNLNKNVTKVKIDAIVLGVMEAFFDSDPLFAITPRPEFGSKVGQDVADKQQDFLDYKLDKLPFQPEMELVGHSGTVKGTGWLEVVYDIQREPRKREEHYEAKLTQVQDPNTGQPVMQSQGLIEFLKNWPSAAKDYPGYIKTLQSGKDITLVANYKQVVYNDPRPRYHDIKHVWVRLKTDGYEGMKTTRLYSIVENFTYWELKKEEKAEKFYDIDKLVDLEVNGEMPENFETLDFDIWKCTYYFKMNEDDTDEIKVVLWINREKKIVIGSTLYPYYAIPANLIPFYIKRKKKGIYQHGVAEDLTDSNMAENAILNLTLESAYMQNTITPITKDPDVHTQFLEKRFYPGVAIDGDPKQVDFLQRHMQPMNMNGLIQLIQYMVQGDDEVSRVSSLMTGRESPTDPSAPARKTLALLRQSGRGVMDYIKHLMPSFNEIGYIMLAMYYQMSTQGQAYTPNPERVVGGDPFAVMTRNDMVARTNIETRAYAFEEDKVNEKVLDLSLYQTIRSEPLIAKNPNAVYTLLNQLVTGWSKKWKNISKRIIPTFDEFQKMQLQTAVAGVKQYTQALAQEKATTGVEPEMDPNKLVALIADLEAQLVTNVDPKVKKEQEKQANA